MKFHSSDFFGPACQTARTARNWWSDCLDCSLFCSARIAVPIRRAHPCYPVIQRYRIRQNELEFVARLLPESRASNMHTMFSENGLFIGNYLLRINIYTTTRLLVVTRWDGEKCILGHWGKWTPWAPLIPAVPRVLQLQANASYLHFCPESSAHSINGGLLQHHPAKMRIFSMTCWDKNHPDKFSELSTELSAVSCPLWECKVRWWRYGNVGIGDPPLPPSPSLPKRK